MGYYFGFLVIWVVVSLFAQRYLRLIPKIGHMFANRVGIIASMIATPLIIALVLAALYLIAILIDFILHPNTSLFFV